MKRFLALLLAITLVLSIFPAVHAQTAQDDSPRTYTAEDYAPINALFDELVEIEDARPVRNGGALSESTVQALIEKIESSDLYVEGTLQRDAYALTWKTTSGIACYHSLVEEENDRGESEGEPIVPPESGYEHISYAKRGQPNGVDVYLVGPYYGYDSNFTDHYKTVAESIASVTGGSYTLYSGSNATIDNVAKAISNGAIVLVDSHGTYGSSKSYLRLKSGTGLTDADYNGNAYYDADTSHGEAWMVTGNAIANHMTKNAPNSFVWLGICSGMRYNTMHKPLMNKGVEATFGYSRTISFHFDRNWLSAFIKSINAGNTVATAAAAMKKSVGYWDRCDESSYDTKTEAINAGKAFPIFVSAEDSYPSDLQNYQTVKSTWKLADCTHPSLSAVAAKDATCTTDGNIAYYTCSLCNGCFTDANASSETTSDKVTVKAYGHSYSSGVCTRCGSVENSLLWHFWPNSTEASYTWVGEGTDGDGNVTPTLTTTGRGTLKSTSGGDDHYFHMLKNSYVIGHAINSGDIIEIRYKTTSVPSSMLNKSHTFEFWYSTPDNDANGFSTSRRFTSSVTMKEDTWQTVTFTPSSAMTLQRVLFDFLQEDNGFSGTTLVLDYMYIGPSANAPSAQKSDELWFDFTNKESDQYRYAGEAYGDMNFDNGKWYVGSTLSAQSIDNNSGEFIGTLASDTTSCHIRTGVDATANEAQLVYKPGANDYFQARFKITDAEATADNLSVIFYFYSKTSNAWYSASATAYKSILGNYYVASIPLASVANYQNAGSISSVQMNISNFKSASGKTAKLYVDYIYVGENTPNPVTHEFEKVVTPPTCTENGYTVNTCKLCGYSFESEVTDPLNHENTRTETTQATCEQAGEIKVVCNDCGEVLSTETIPAGNHAETTTLRIEATCTTDGEISEICELCGEVLSKEVIKATGHSYEATVTAPTCTERGYTTYVCACGDTTVSDYVAATGHSYTSKVTTAPGCETNGVRTYTCHCGASYTEAISAIGHDYKSELTQATCTTNGYTTYTCSNCGDCYQGNFVNAFGHAYSYDDNENGTHNVTCAYNCGYQASEEHTFTNGMCACGALEITACKHNQTTTVTTEPTCTASGSKVITCDDCGETVLSEVIPALGHTLELLAGSEATCTTGGYLSHWSCKTCGVHFVDEAGKYAVPEAYFAVEALGHNVSYFAAKNPTCTENGCYAHYFCVNCKGYFFDEACEFPAPESYVVIAATGHDHIFTDNGDNHTVTCSKCDYSAVQDHVFDGQTCVCGAAKKPQFDENLKFTMNISVGAEISVSYNLLTSAVSKYDDFYLEVCKETAGGEPYVMTYGISEGHNEMGNLADFFYYVTYTGITAKEMGDSFSTTLYATSADGTVYYGTTTTESIRDYLLSRYNASTATDEFKTMAIDMLKYGAAAQVQFDYDTQNLVTSGLTAQQLSYATQGIATAVDRSAETANGANISKMITLGSKVELNLNCMYTGASDPSNVKCVIIGADGSILAELPTTNAAGVIYSATFDQVGAKEMRNVISATFFDGGLPISKTIYWSVESYVAQIRAKENVSQTELDMVNAMLAYGDSVATYMTATGQ